MSEVQAGQSIGELSVPVDRARLVRYAGASGDFNPIHWDDRFATSVGLPDVIAHGMWTMGAAAELVARWIGDAGRITSYGVRFSKPLPVPYEGGATLTVTGEVKSVDGDTATIAITATNGEESVLTRALATVRL
ncbi:MaoC family dehydratase [Calidifontibacter sp. DB0510]|uniref:MaoC family dehydratase n=1 Tax=Metallococcus carri TaxID=1656884 RepID=A0A967AY91_9MICO|nr:MaoC family dehydratase [Metallococcus carri]NHN55214.1 MaoC family dehydratase [Metallococcus carri]NOP36291.1 MaoC family dehydratase [Calidifontibacter sp. DB2511S]